MEAVRKKIGAHEIDKHWNLVIRREVNGKNRIVSILSFNRNRAPDGRLIKNKYRLCEHGGMNQWGVNLWETYSPVFNWMSVRAILTLSILRYLHTKSIYFVLAYTQDCVKSDIFMEIPIVFGVEGVQPR